MSDAPQLSREQLETNWQAWVTANLGSDTARGTIAVNAAVDAVLQGKSLAAASAAATNAWTQAGGRPPSWRLTFWGLLAGDTAFLVAIGVLTLAQLFWFSPAGPLSLLIDVAVVPPVVLKVIRANRLSRIGIVAPGMLVKTAAVSLGRGTSYASTYEFEHDGPHFVSRMAGDAPHDVLVLFDPTNLHTATVVPTQLDA